MMDRNEPAFPVNDVGVHGSFGVSVRDYAAINLPGFEVKFEGLEHAAKSLGLTAPAEDDMPGIIRFAFEIEAMMRYMRADAMLAERAKERTP